MLVEPDYKGYRIEVAAQHADGAWNAEVRVRRTLSEMKPHVEVVTCRKPTAKAAEERAAIYARRWIDRRGQHPGPSFLTRVQHSSLPRRADFER